jgi:hypothetical protein
MATSTFLLWFCYEEGDGSTPSSMVTIFYFLFFWCLWFSSLGLTLNRGRRLKKSGGGELEINKQNVAALDEANVVPDVVAGDEVVAEPHVATSNAAIVEQNIAASDATIAQQNVVASIEAIGDRSVVASDQEIGEQNGALSQLKHTDNNLV